MMEWVDQDVHEMMIELAGRVWRMVSWMTQSEVDRHFVCEVGFPLWKGGVEWMKMMVLTFEVDEDVEVEVGERFRDAYESDGLGYHLQITMSPHDS